MEKCSRLTKARETRQLKAHYLTPDWILYWWGKYARREIIGLTDKLEQQKQKPTLEWTAALGP